jgi:hypothetical protein
MSAASLSRPSKVYAQLFEKYDGRKIADDTTEFLETTSSCAFDWEIVSQLEMEILLHNLADPAHSLIALENNVTGRAVRDGTTSFLIDLKKRQLLHEDKLNYEINIGAENSIHDHPDFAQGIRGGGGICINVTQTI